MSKPSGKPNGRPLVFIDWELAEKLAKIQCTCREIAAVLGVNPDTLADRCKRDNKLTFSEWYNKFTDQGKVSLRRSLWKAATAERPNPAIAIWLSKQHLGMMDRIDSNQTIMLNGTPTVNLIFEEDTKNKEEKDSSIIDVEASSVSS